MKSAGTLMAAVGLVVLLFSELLAGPPAQGRGAKFGSGPRADIQKYWRAPVRHHTHDYRNYHYYPNFYLGHDPRSVIIIAPPPYHPYHAPVRVVTSQPFYCHVHHVGFVSRVGFLDHISGTHKISLETAGALCTDGNASCVIEGY